MTRPFVPPGTATHYTPDRPVEVVHVRLDVEPDLAARKLAGRSSLTMAVRRDRVDAVVLHAVDMAIGAVTVDGQAVAAVDYDGDRLRVPLPRPFERGERFTV